VQGTVQTPDLANAINFSTVSINSISYGDLVAASGAARILASLEVIAGVVLLQVVFSEIASYDSETEQALAGDDEDTDSPDCN